MDVIHITGEAINESLIEENRALRATVQSLRSALDALIASHHELQQAFLAAGRDRAATAATEDYLVELRRLRIYEAAVTASQRAS